MENIFYKIEDFSSEYIPKDFNKEVKEILINVRDVESVYEEGYVNFVVNILFYSNDLELLYRTRFVVTIKAKELYKTRYIIMDEVDEKLEDIIFEYYNYKLDVYEESKN